MTRSFHIPRGPDGGAAVVLAVAFIALFLICYGGASWLSEFVPWRLRAVSAFDLAVPFVPGFAYAYLSLILLLSLAPFVLDRRELGMLFVGLSFELAVGSICFLLFPIDTMPIDPPASGFSAWAFKAADVLNLDHNYLPSLHVAFACTAAFVYIGRAGTVVRFALLGWVTVVVASTVLIHAHYIIDVFAGIGLATLTWYGFIVRLGEERIRRLDIELYCLGNFVMFGRRHPRYWMIAAGLYAASIGRWRERRILRTGFCFLQLVDDFLDGDRPSAEEPLDLTERLVHALETGRFGSDDIMNLAADFAADLRRIGGPGAIRDAVDLIRNMQADRRRVLARALHTREQLAAHHRRTFQLSVNLMLIAARAELRIDDVPELLEAFGWCSTMRDLEQDLSAGLINIPQDLLVLTPDADRSNWQVLQNNPRVRSWMRSEHERALQRLDAADERLRRLPNVAGAKLLKMFCRSIRDYAVRRFPRQYPRIAEATTAATAVND